VDGKTHARRKSPVSPWAESACTHTLMPHRFAPAHAAAEDCGICGITNDITGHNPPTQVKELTNYKGYTYKGAKEFDAEAARAKMHWFAPQVITNP
jgi:hypothetical protein